MTKLQEKMYYTGCGYLLAFANILLIETRYSQIGLGLGLLSAYFFIKALRIRL